MLQKQESGWMLERTTRNFRSIILIICFYISQNNVNEIKFQILPSLIQFITVSASQAWQSSARTNLAAGSPRRRLLAMTGQGHAMTAQEALRPHHHQGTL
jgi:hypothetical protein